MGNVIVVLILLVIISVASYKLYLDKKNNVKCSGCPSCKIKDNCPSSKK